MEETYNYKGLRIRIEQDCDPFDPEEGDAPVYLVHFHRQLWRCPEEAPFRDERGFREFLNGPDRADYDLDDEDDRERYNDDLADWKEERKQWRVFLVSSYIHSGIVLALAGSREDAQFPDRQWDVSHCGVILIRDDHQWFDGNLTDDRAREIAVQHLEVWNQYLAGDVWGYIVERPETCPHCGHTEYEDLDSCWGFYGLDNCKAAAEAAADCYVKEKGTVLYGVRVYFDGDAHEADGNGWSVDDGPDRSGVVARFGTFEEAEAEARRWAEINAGE